MKNLIKRLPAFAKGNCLNVVIETPKGSNVKYAYAPSERLFALKRALPEGMMFPFNFGFVPSTKAEDGDPLDILVLNEGTLFPGCLIQAEVLGAIEAEQSENGKKTRNDRLIVRAVTKESPTSLESMELTKKTVHEIEHFFKAYNKLAGKKFKVLRRVGPKKALGLVRKSIKAFRA
jgi:inorganic pyrophosphatase